MLTYIACIKYMKSDYNVKLVNSTSNHNSFTGQEIKWGSTAADKCWDISILITSPALLLTAGVRVPNGSERFQAPAKDQVKITLTLQVELLFIKGDMI